MVKVEPYAEEPNIRRLIAAIRGEGLIRFRTLKF